LMLAVSLIASSAWKNVHSALSIVLASAMAIVFLQISYDLIIYPHNPSGGVIIFSK
jgi:hypothetical protein